MSVHINRAQETFNLLLKSVEELKTGLKPDAHESVKKYIRYMIEILGDHLERDIDLVQYNNQIVENRIMNGPPA